MTVHRRGRYAVPFRRALMLTEGTSADPSQRRRLDSLMREVSETRREIELNLTMAAGATEADRTALAGELVDDTRARVAVLQERLLDHLAGLHSAGSADRLDPDDLGVAAGRTAPPPAHEDLAAVTGSGWRRALLPLAPLLATAAAVATLLSGAPGPVTNPGTQPMSQQSVLQADFDSLGDVVLRRSDENSVLAAVRRLHDAVRPLVTVAGTDPASAATARTVLLRQRELVRRERPEGALTALAETDEILAALHRVGVALPPLQGLLVDTPSPSPASAQDPARPPAGRPLPTSSVSRPAPSPVPDSVAPARPVPLAQLERNASPVSDPRPPVEAEHAAEPVGGTGTELPTPDPAAGPDTPLPEF